MGIFPFSFFATKFFISSQEQQMICQGNFSGKISNLLTDVTCVLACSEDAGDGGAEQGQGVTSLLRCRDGW